MADSSIVDLDEAILRLGLEDNPDVRRALSSALRAAQAKLEGLYDSPFDAVLNRTDTFSVSTSKFPQNIDGYFRCRLSQAFVWPDPVITMAEREAWSFSEATDLGYQVGTEKGILYVPQANDNQLVTITYSAGFDETHKAPTWLVETLLAYLPWVLNSQQVTNRSQEQEGQVTKVQDLSGSMIAPYMRGRGFHFHPLFR